MIDLRDGPWSAPERTLMGTQQERWPGGEFERSTVSGTCWQVLARQIVMGRVRFPAGAANWIPANVPEAMRPLSGFQG